MISLGILTYNTVNSFKFQIVTTTSGETFTLPLGSSSGNIQNFIVNWGDTTSSEITAYNDPDRIHTYTSAGTYDIEMIGISQYLAFSTAIVADRNRVRKLLSFTGDIGFKTLNFWTCPNLNTIISLGTLNSLNTAQSMFEGCTSLTSIPTGIFNSCPNIATFIYTFYGCSGLIGAIPTDLFKYNISVNSFYQTFWGCSKLTTIPIDLFRYNTLVTTFGGTFNNCSKITSIPIDLFKYNVLVTDFSYVFNGLTIITSIPTDLFRYNIAVTNFTYVFGNCNALTILPVGLFNYNVSVTSFQAAFYQCAILSTIPEGLFRNNTIATNFYYTFGLTPKVQLNAYMFYNEGEQGTRFLNKNINFYGLIYRTSFTGIQGTAPDLWNCNFGTGTPTKTLCYGGGGNSLISISNYASIPVAWRT